MAKTYRDLVTEARELLQDTLDPFRWEDTYLLNTLNRALQELGRIRPDAFYALYDANSLNVPIIVDEAYPDEDAGEVDWDTAFQIDMMFYTPVMVYVVGSIELTEDEFSVDGRAITLLQQFRNTVVGI